MMHGKPKTKKELRNFGFVMFVPLAIIAGFLWWKGRSAYPYVGGAALFFLLTGLIFPAILRPIEKVWMKFAELLGAVMTRVILTITYFLIVTPIGIIKRLSGNDSLGLKRDPDAQSFWIPVDPDGPSSRYDKPF